MSILLYPKRSDLTAGATSTEYLQFSSFDFTAAQRPNTGREFPGSKMQRALSLVCVGVISASAAAVTASPDSTGTAATAVQINGWFHCSASTLYATKDSDNYHDDAYFLETARAARATTSAKQPRGANHRTTKHSSRAVPPRVASIEHGRSDAALWGTSSLRDPLAFAQSHANWRAHQATPPPHGPHSAINKQHKKDTKKTKKGEEEMEGEEDTGVDDDESKESSSSPHYECAEFRVPFCYDGICESNRTLDVFVKRVVAQHTSNTSDSASVRGKALWLLQGGPGASSTAMEDLMETMYTQLRGEVSIYTMDHRGTARSHRLECQAAGAQTPGSPGGTFVGLEETPDCIRDILFQIDNQTAAFSVTSAAMDLRTIIDHSLADQDVFVYGLSYGTYLVERLIHVAPTSVKGFVMDGIVSESGASVEERSTYSNWDHDVGMVGARFFGYCEQDPFCRAQFPTVALNTTNTGHLTAFVKELYARLDTIATNSSIAKCADALKSSGKRPSYFLRSAFSDLLMDADARIVIPAIVARAARCSDDDARALQHFVSAWTQSSEQDDGNVDLDDVLFTSQMLYSVIVFSELWEYPSPTKQQLLQWYEDATMGSDNYATLPYYCLFTGSREPACKVLKHLPTNSPSMRYERDAFWNSTATLPPQATALLLSGGLDLQTRRMYGDLEYELLRGGDRMLVYFDYAGHCTTFTTPTKAGGATCGVRILASYVENDGDVARVNTSCVGDVYGLDFQSSSKFDLAGGYFGTNDLFG